MAIYAVNLNRTASTTLAVGNITAPATGMRRIALHKLVLGSDGTAASAALRWLIERCTTAGTRTAVTPESLDPAEVAAVTTAGRDHSANGTSGNAVMQVPLNQLATFTYEAAPGREILAPATANNGLQIQTPVAPAVSVYAHAEFVE